MKFAFARSALKPLSFFLIALCLITFSLYKLAHSKDDSTDNNSLESNLYGIAINPITDIAVVTNEKTDSVSIVDLNTNTITSTVNVGRNPKGIAIDKGLNIAVVSNSHDNNLSVIDLNTYQVLTSLPVGKSPEGIAINPLTHTAFVANHKDGTISVIDLKTHKLLTSIPVGREPKEIAVDPLLNLTLVVNEKENKEGGDEDKKENDYTVSVIDSIAYQLTSEVLVGKKPKAIDINPETHMAVVANEKDNTITVIDLQTWGTSNIEACKHPTDIAINQLNNSALVLCDEEKSLIYIDLNTKAITKTYSVDKEPKAVAVNNFTNIAAVISDKTDGLKLIQLSNPIPQITSINPSTVYRGSPGESVLIEGSGFIKASKAYFENQTFETTFIDNHNLNIKIPKELLLNTGTFWITVINPSPEGGISNPINIQINNPAPTILMLDPPEIMTGTPSLNLTIYGTGFFNDTTVYINNMPRTFTFISQTKLQTKLTAADLEVGAYLQVTASNSLPGGGISNPATFTVLNPVPELIAINPTTIIAKSPNFTLTLTGNNFVKTSVVSFNNRQFPARYISKTQIEAIIPSDAIITPGNYPVEVINSLPGGGKTLPLTFTVKPPLEIKITSPSNGMIINKAKTIVKGTIKSDTKDIGINVNGIIAEIRGSEWIANDVPLTIGTNTITATATDSYGNKDTTAITINVNDTSQQVELSSSPTSGIAPLTITFSATISFIPVSYQMDFNGDGIADYTGATFNNITYTYTTEGIYYPTVTITDNQGNTYSDTIAIMVQNKIELDTLLKSKWEGMKAALKAKDIEKALSYFDVESRDRYKAIFEALKDKMPTILDTFIEFNFIKLYGHIIEYEIVTSENGVLYSYPIMFVRGADGVWRFKDF